MADPKTPNRQQLTRIVGGDQEALRLVERLFKVSGEQIPATIEKTIYVADSAAANVNKTAAAIQALLDDMGLLPPRVPFEAQDDLTPPRAPLQPTEHARPPVSATMQALGDVDSSGAAAGDVLVFDGSQWVPVTGASGTFTTSDPFTVTVTNGVITSIV